MSLTMICPTCGARVRWIESFFAEFAPEGTDETIIFHPCLHRETREVGECPVKTPSTAATRGSSSENAASSGTDTAARDVRQSESRSAASPA